MHRRRPKKSLDSDLVTSIIKDVEEKLGNEPIRKLKKVKFISTGVKVIDWALGGGIPIGRLSEFFGDFSTGKTLIGMQFLREVQKRNGIAVFLDSESSFSENMAENIGLDYTKLLYFKPQTIEKVFQVLDTVINEIRKKFPEGLVGIVWDSIAATTSEEEMKKGVGFQEMGIRARLIGQGLRRLMINISDKNIALMFINQLREKIGVVYGKTWITSGGKAPEFHSSIRVMLKSGNKIKNEKGKVIGQYGKLEVVKNKVAPPFREVDFEMYYDQGIPEYSGLLEHLFKEGIVENKGGWWYFKDKEEEKFRRKDFPNFIQQNSELIKEALK